jgi:cbb3-type cytochrome c oxidase subunit III
MQSILKLGVVSVFFIAGVFIFSTRETQVSAANYTGLASPRTLFIQNCARCHGADGKAQTELGRKLEADDLTSSDASTAKIIRTITNGRGDMPSFRKKLSARHIASLAGYVRSL